MNRTEAANFEYRTDENNHVWIVSLNGKKTKDASRRMTRALSDTQDLLCIPETINGRTVVGIDPQAFRNEDKNPRCIPAGYGDGNRQSGI